MMNACWVIEKSTELVRLFSNRARGTIMMANLASFGGAVADLLFGPCRAC